LNEAQIHVWLCSPDEGFARAIADELGPNFETELANEIRIAENSKLFNWWHVALLDLRSAANDADPTSSFQLIEHICQIEPAPPVLVILPANERGLALKAMSMGAYDVVESPPNMVELRLVIRRAERYRQSEWDLSRLKAEEPSRGQLFDLIGASDELQQVFSLARKVAACDVSVLITGETGTGKELLARAIHKLSSRAPWPFVAFSCANLPENLVDDELFGHERGAFTGAVGLRRGRFEMADRGVLFLDEIGDLPLGLQPKLLRVLQEHTFERLGSSTPISTDVRTICATNRNLAEMVGSGTFREDLFYRLNVFQLHIPPLRERRSCIPVLAQHFLQRFSVRFGKNVKRFSRQAVHALAEHSWPGNVRELENVIQHAVVLAEGPTIELWHLPAALHREFDSIGLGRSHYEDELREFKRRLIVRTLQECNWNKTEGARRLGVARGYLYRLIAQLQIQEGESLDSNKVFVSQPPTRHIM
jgi:DNA-binding NtrC family response regulator